MKNQLVTLKQIDKQLFDLKKQIPLTPKQGWIRTLRKALGITIKQLAKRLDVDPSRVVKIEMSEPKGAINLHTMESVAEALDCRFVYAFIPNNNLEEIIKARAVKSATEQVQRTSHTMSLESQAVDQAFLNDQIKELSDEMLRHSWKYLWEE